jgi:hypothetical protein
MLQNLEHPVHLKRVDPRLSEKMDKIFEHFGVKRTKQMDNVTEESKPIETQPTQSLDNNDLNFDF